MHLDNNGAVLYTGMITLTFGLAIMGIYIEKSSVVVLLNRLAIV